MPSPRYAPPKDLSGYAWLSVGAALATITLKALAWWLTGSVGLLSDAAESLVNLVAALVAVIVLKIAIRPADADHQFGHSKAEYFSSVCEGIMIFVAAAFIIFSAVERIITPVMPERLSLGLVISVGASLVNGIVAWVLLRRGRAEHSAALVADAKHLLTDVVTSAAVLAGVGLVAVFHSPVLDAVVALGAGLNIMWTGFQLIRDSVGGLMDVAPDREALERINAVLDERRREGVVDFHAVRVREAGSRRFAHLHVLVPGTWTVKRGHDYTESLIDELVAADPSLRVSAHLEPIEDPLSYADVEDV
ncbi:MULTISPECIES: cation diffusion facilitator family transporter [unclassified Actinomyces]|uniref:cation diffusion facilitator family transporter n=1 Tax=unclassified Actinomyces TaxID=2609248 RepID=UPI001373CF7F|nr:MULTISPECIES: cation diffusion facilitator family transporter [unclassified Actinomyces]MBW3069193.1 cation transporter [Actinomyces sp. 594]NDR53373.1 cation transporter [Actinomyces sp. 565]QHO91885.1 cation-efflux pump [Actinomyces sp. 432]